jgi:signal transduction histidine kinase
MSKKLIDWNLRQKILLHIFVVGILVTVVLFYLFFSMQNDLINTLNQQKAEMVATMIDCNVTHHMEEGKSRNVGPALSRISAPSSIKRLRIIDIEGNILNSSDPDEIQNRIDADELNSLKSLYPDLHKDHIFGLKPTGATRSYIAIPNREECYGCHTPEKRIVGILEIQLDDSLTSSLLHSFQFKSIIIGLAALLILTIIILRLFEKIINRPLSRLKDYMKKIQTGDLHGELEAIKQDEIGDLTQSFNIMVKKLDEANLRIENLHKQQMERAGHLASLGELAAGLAHEIKNPIAGIKGSLEIIAERTDPSDPTKEIFGEVLKQTDRIHAIVQDLLHYAKPRELQISKVNPNLCLQEAINLAKPQIIDKDIEFQYVGTNEDIKVTCDANKLQEVILNLILNSIAAIEKAGTIAIEVEQRQENEIMISVTDDGKGIKSEHLEQLFTPFFTTRKAGTGLGLSISRQIIEAHGGHIEVKSERGRGTTFYLHLPMNRVDSG